ncbi:MAG: hypothetical protein NTZ68_04475 [Candidatus Dependentiae bacterium]|nr:hypothetical protein [Candidatus Dependentiae bacterium]
MKKLIILATCISLQIAASQDSHWKMDSRQAICLYDGIDCDNSDEKFFIRVQEEYVGLNHRGKPVFIKDGIICTQNEKLFIMHATHFDEDEASHQEQLVCQRLGNRETQRIFEVLQAVMQ